VTTIVQTIALRTPPVLSGGLPLLGHLLEFQKNPVALMRRGLKEIGMVFTIKLGPKNVAVVIGPEHNTLVFNETDKKLSIRDAYSFLVAMFGKVIFTAEEKEYQHQRAEIAPALGGKKMGGYVNDMLAETHDWIAKLGDAGSFDVVTEFELLSMLIAARSLMGEEFHSHIGTEFYALYRDLSAGIEPILPSNLPLPRFRRRDSAKAKLHEMIGGMVEQRRAAPAGTYDDFFQTLVEMKNAEGSGLMDRESITNIILGLVFAGHETTSSHMSWALVQLLQNPAYLERVKANLPEEISLNTVNNFDLMDWALKETERMNPAAEILLRVNSQPYEVTSYHVPAGWLTMISPAVSHRLPHIYRNPDSYEPERFSPERAEDRKQKNSLVGFGGGMHKCWGMNFAYTEMNVVLTLLLKTYDLTLANPNPKSERGGQAPRPERSTAIKYKRHA
jgi:sterol 14-demethylase